jgi:hypothetical protein
MTDLEAGRSEAAGIPTRAGLDRTAGLLLEGPSARAGWPPGWPASAPSAG